MTSAMQSNRPCTASWTHFECQLKRARGQFYKRSLQGPSRLCDSKVDQLEQVRINSPLGQLKEAIAQVLHDSGLGGGVEVPARRKGSFPLHFPL